MAILTTKTPIPAAANAAYKTQADLKTSTLFDKELPVTKITHQVSGMSWTVDYFNQIVGVNTQPLAPDINIPETRQSYNRVNKLDIYVDSGLPNSSAVDITGSGTINAGFLPYVGDAFTATVAGGRIAIFIITAVTKEFYNTHDIYIIDFKLTYFTDTSAANYNDLVYKTAHVYVYDKDAIDTFSNPVILDSDYTSKLNLKSKPAELANYYIDTFLNKDDMTLVMKSINTTYLDPIVVKVFFKAVSVSDVPDLLNVRRPDGEITIISIWDAILRQDIHVLDTCVRSMGYVKNIPGSPASINLLEYIGIDYIMSDNVAAPWVTPAVLTNPLSQRKVVESPITAPDTNYIFNADFYNQTAGAVYSNFETVVLQYLRKERPNRALVDQLLTEYKYWSYEDQYYLVPMLLIIVKSLVNNTYSSL